MAGQLFGGAPNGEPEPRIDRLAGILAANEAARAEWDRIWDIFDGIDRQAKGQDALDDPA